MAAAFERSGVERAHCHRFRHTHAARQWEPLRAMSRSASVRKKDEQAQAAGWAHGATGAARINQDAHMFVAELAKGGKHPLSTGLSTRRLAARRSGRGGY